MDSHKKSWKENKMLLLEIALVLLLAALSLPVLVTMMGGPNSITGSVVHIGDTAGEYSVDLPVVLPVIDANRSSYRDDSIASPLNETEEVNEGDFSIELPLELPPDDEIIIPPNDYFTDPNLGSPDGVIALPVPEEGNDTPDETIP
ncbi:MAG: hypothetical protein Q8R37_00420, partial [Nanoarchaeota archaeon]|nr:hypothetical protein [Nanoarchaeota archaeon]